jgi:hypothetical protein
VIFHPFALSSRRAHGRVLKPVIDSPTYEAKTLPEIAYLCASVVDDEAATAKLQMRRELRDCFFAYHHRFSKIACGQAVARHPSSTKTPESTSAR